MLSICDCWNVFGARKIDESSIHDENGMERKRIKRTYSLEHFSMYVRFTFMCDKFLFDSLRQQTYIQTIDGHMLKIDFNKHLTNWNYSTTISF